MAMGAQREGLAFLPAASARPQCHRSRDAVRAEASGQHHAAWSRSTWPLLQHFSPASAQQSFAASQRTSCPWVRAQTQSDGDSLTEHLGGVEETQLLSVIGGPCVVSRVCCVPRASPCAVEKSSRSFSCNPEHGLRPLIHEIGVPHHASYAPATRDGQGAGSEARALLLLSGHCSLPLVCSSWTAVLPHRCPLAARTIPSARPRSPFAQQPL